MHNWDKRYTDQVQLLVDILPVLSREERFALKGGTAINLFERDLPRLSVDIDLTWLPVQDFETDVVAISVALEHLAETFRARPLQLQVQTSGGVKTGGITRLICSRGRARVQIETSPVMRGAVHPVRTMTVQPAVEKTFGFASTQVLDFADLYAGKLAAACPVSIPEICSILVCYWMTRGWARRCGTPFWCTLPAVPSRPGKCWHPGSRSISTPSLMPTSRG